MNSLIIGECADSKPSDYDNNGISYCVFTCQEWAAYGFCDKRWKGFKKCKSASSVDVKDTCKASCNNCGKFLVMLLLSQY